MTAVAVLGAYGRMGSAACAAVGESDDLRLVAKLGRGDRLEQVVASGASVAVDLTRPDTVMDNLEACIRSGVHCVVVTSGFTPDRLAWVRELLADAPGVGVLVAPNFSLGAVLMMRFAEQAAHYFDAAEVVELHHAGKADAPSGTARRTAELVAASRAAGGLDEMPDATTSDPEGARGAVIDGVHVHSVRMPGLVGHQQVLLGGHDETLTIRHDSMNRSSFMPGVLLGIRTVADRPGLTVGLDGYLDL